MLTLWLIIKSFQTKQHVECCMTLLQSFYSIFSISIRYIVCSTKYAINTYINFKMYGTLWIVADISCLLLPNNNKSSTKLSRFVAFFCQKITKCYFPHSSFPQIPQRYVKILKFRKILKMFSDFPSKLQ